MNFIDKKQPPSRIGPGHIGVISTEGLRPLLLSSFLPDVMRGGNSKAKVYLFTTKETAQHKECFHFDDTYNLSSNKAQNTALLLFHSKIKKITHFIDLNEQVENYYPFTDSLLSLKKLEVQKISEPEKYFVLLHALGLKPEKLNFKLKIKSETYGRVSHELIDRGFDLRQLNLVAPEGEGFKNKTWKPFETAVRLLINKKQRVMILPGEETAAVSEKLYQEFPEKINLWKLNRSFEETIAMISRAKNFFGAENIWTYAASQLDIPTLAIYGPSVAPSSEFLKLRNHLSIIRAQLPCSPCQTSAGVFDFNCRDNVCMKSHSPEEVVSYLR